MAFAKHDLCKHGTDRYCLITILNFSVLLLMGIQHRSVQPEMHKDGNVASTTSRLPLVSSGYVPLGWVDCNGI